MSSYSKGGSGQIFSWNSHAETAQKGTSGTAGSHPQLCPCCPPPPPLPRTLLCHYNQSYMSASANCLPISTYSPFTTLNTWDFPLERMTVQSLQSLKCTMIILNIKEVSNFKKLKVFVFVAFPFLNCCCLEV